MSENDSVTGCPTSPKMVLAKHSLKSRSWHHLLIIFDTHSFIIDS